MDTIDRLARGKGLSIAKVKLTTADGRVEYYFSRPKLKPWDLIGWLWYFSHKRNLAKQP